MALILLGGVGVLSIVGSGGSSGTAVLQGQFIDSPVGGLRYETDTQSGVTDADGTFMYLDGERVQFYIGDLMLGEASGQPEVTPFDIVAGAEPLTGTAIRRAYGTGEGLFHTVVSIATLLQTLDHDGDPDNGIEITADVAALFAADSVDFDQTWWDFQRDRGLQQALSQADADGLLAGERRVRKPWQVMQHLYASLQLDSELKALSHFSSDNDNDGMPNSITMYAYDADGKQTASEWDQDGDGTVDGIRSYEYDAYGNQIRSEWDDAADGTIDAGNTTEFDHLGNQTRSEGDHDGDGMPDQISIWEYDADGNQIRNEEDTDGDGTADQIRTSVFLYDGDGNLARIEQDFDSDGDGTPDQFTTLAYRADGHLDRIVDDTDGDGLTDQITIYLYDADGHPVRSEKDLNGDGIANRITTWEYDADGNQIRSETDSNADGTPDDILTQEYDADGNLTRTAADFDGDGMPDYITIREYDTGGNRTRVEVDGDGDGMTDSIATYANGDADGWWTMYRD